MMKRTHNQRRGLPRTSRQPGFTLLEVMISTVIMGVGLLAILGLFTVSLNSTQSVQLDMIARQKATETLESIFTARQTSQISFAQIQNVPNGIFTAGMVAMTDPGPDGLDGTGDDVPAAPIRLPGPDGILNTADDTFQSLADFQRQVQIINIPAEPNVRQVIVTVQYPNARGQIRSYTVQALISSFR
jgi:prepilin-type N-terminal cleavage/methylation domain-containing protein